MNKGFKNLRHKLFEHRLKVFILGLTVIIFLSLSVLPKILLTTVTSLNEEIGYTSIVSALAAAGQYVEEQTEPGSIDRAMGYRYALRRIEMLNNLFLPDHGFQAPIISRCPSRLCKYGFDNPDTTYNMIYPLSGKNQYKVTGNRGTVTYVTFQVMNIGPDGFNAGAVLEANDLLLDENGDFEILLATENPTNHPNFVPIGAHSSAQFLVRQLNTDWQNSIEASLKLEVISPNPAAPEYPPIFNMDMMRKRGFGYAIIVRNQMRIWRDVILNAPVNRLETGDKRAGNEDGGFPTNFTATMQYQLEPEQAIIIEIARVDVIYNNIQLGTLWGESLDYGARLVSYNHTQAHLDTDGIYRYVIAQSDPHVPNWLDATGHPKGGVFARWQTPETLVPPAIVKVVPLAKLRDYLPPDHPRIIPTMRIEQLLERRNGYNRRLNPVDMR